VSYFSQQDWLMGPWLVLAVCGVILFRRHRTAALALMVIGFSAALVAGIAQFVAYYELSHLYQTSRLLTAADVKPYGWTFVLARYGSLGGPWIAALGLLWHVLRHGPSPNNRLERPVTHKSDAT
jgi:hypothetical protein